MGIKLIALMLLTGITLIDGTVQDIAEGAEFEVAQADADALIADGKAKVAEASLTPPSTPPTKAKPLKVRLLVDCEFGKANDVVTLAAAEAKEAEKQGLADSNKDAVAYALTLPQNQA